MMMNVMTGVVGNLLLRINVCKFIYQATLLPNLIDICKDLTKLLQNLNGATCYPVTVYR